MNKDKLNLNELENLTIENNRLLLKLENELNDHIGRLVDFKNNCIFQKIELVNENLTKFKELDQEINRLIDLQKLIL